MLNMFYNMRYCESGSLIDIEYDDNDASHRDDDKMADDASKSETGPDGEAKKKYDPKDPMRPRRKKARRACFACQRAHLTCGMLL